MAAGYDPTIVIEKVCQKSIKSTVFEWSPATMPVDVSTNISCIQSFDTPNIVRALGLRREKGGH